MCVEGMARWACAPQRCPESPIPVADYLHLAVGPISEPWWPTNDAQRHDIYRTIPIAAISVCYRILVTDVVVRT